MTSEVKLSELAMRLLDKPFDELDAEEQRVISAIAGRVPTSRDISDTAVEKDSFGARLSDRVAAVGGSWAFIMSFGVILFGWMFLNSGLPKSWGVNFDPYPFIFLNLMLSTLAAVQAPIIMMSQNRQAEKDRQSARLDYEINLRAELEVMGLHQKIDHLPMADIQRQLADISARLERMKD